MFMIVQAIWNGLKWLGGVIVAPVAKLRQVRGIGRIVRYVVHALVILLVLVGLTWANYYFQLDAALRTPVPGLRLVWLPLLFLLVYSLCWLGWYVSRLIAAGQEASPFPDIDAAWRTATDAIARAGIDIAKTPLYLIVGRPAGETLDLIRAARLPLAIPPSPPSDQLAPLTVFAQRDAIYVSCHEVSLLGRQAELFAQAIASAANKTSTIVSEDTNQEAENADVELDAIPIGDSDGGVLTATRTTSAVELQARAGLSLVEDHVAMLVEDSLACETAFETQVQCELDPLPIDLTAALLKDAAEVERITARLEHLCQLIALERQPFVPVNAVLMLTSAVAADCDEAANHVGALAQQDLDAIHAATEVVCPHVALVCDLEQTPGGTELLARFPEEQRQRRLGVRLPTIAECDITKAGEVIDEAIGWLCQGLLPPLIYRLLRAPTDDARTSGETLRGNVALYRFLYRLRHRQQRLARILRRATCCDSQHAGSLAGCYLVATGSDSERQQGFAEAIFAQLPQLASSLAWTPAALDRDARQRRLARCGYASLAALGAMLIVALFAM